MRLFAMLPLLALLLTACGVPDRELATDAARSAAARAAETVSGVTTEMAKAAAAKLYQEAKDRRLTLDHGPCLSDEVVRGMALDIVSDPRVPEDDLPENRCTSEVEGRVRFVMEIDKHGKFLRIR